MGLLSGLVKSLAGPVLGFLGGKADRDSQADANAQNYAAQKEFAQKGIQWKAQDAREAGLHPMAALGAVGSGFTPSFQAFTGNESAVGQLMDAIPGQNTNRAARANMTDQDRELHALAVRRGQLENQLLEGQITQLWSSIMGQPTNPPAPGPSVAGAVNRHGQGSVTIVPSKQESGRIGDPGATAGNTPAMRGVDVGPGQRVDLINPDVAESLEGYGILQAPIAAALHAWRGTSQIRDRFKPPSSKLLPPGHSWRWSVSSGGWVPVKDSSRPRSGPRRDTPAAAARARFRGGASGSW